MTPAEHVDALMMYCLYKPEELAAGGYDGALMVKEEEARNHVPPDCVLTEGIVVSFGFHKERLAEKKEEIRALVKEIVPDEFLLDKGGGWSFLNLCQDRTGALWTGLQVHAQSLYCLASAVGMAKFCLDREFWSALPGGVPYMVFMP